MLGYDMSWAAFNVVEVMSQSKFTAKRIGYLGASQSFHEGTDVIILTQALFKKVNLSKQNKNKTKQTTDKPALWLGPSSSESIRDRLGLELHC